jgi:ribosomal protein S15P/S13E
MSLRRKQGRDFLLGILAGAIGLAAVWHLHPEWHDNGSAALEAAWQRRELLQSAAQPARPVQPVAAPGSAVMGAEEAGLAHGCAFSPILPRTAQDDGRYSLAAALEQPQDSAEPFTVVARESAQDDHARDAEVAFIVACRVQSRIPGSPAAVADIESELAQHYESVAEHEGSADARAEILLRATHLLADSARIYAGVLGAGAPRTRDAQQHLAILSARSGMGEQQAFFTPVLPPAVQVLAHDAQPASAGDVASADAAPLAVRDETETHDAASLVRGDPELAQLDKDLDRLRAQAESVTSHPSALRRDVASARAQRDACGDRACLLRWYAHRREQLLAAF